MRLFVTGDGRGGVTAARFVQERNARGILGERPLRDAELSALRWRFASSQRRPIYAAPSPEEKVYMQLRRLHGLSMPGDSYLNTAVSSVDLGKSARKIAASYRSVDNALHQSPELRLLREQIRLTRLEQGEDAATAAKQTDKSTQTTDTRPNPLQEGNQTTHRHDSTVTASKEAA